MQSTILPAAARDALVVSLRRMETLAALLCALSDRVPCEPLDGEAAGMIAEETTRLRATLNSNLKEGLIRSSPPTTR